MEVGIVGGTGPAGKALAVRLASVGLAVSIGSRSAERGEEIAAQLREKWGSQVADLRGASNEIACASDMVVVATPWDGAPQTVAGLAGLLDGKVVISMANALFKVGDDIEAVVPARGSLCVAARARLGGLPSSPGPRTGESRGVTRRGCPRVLGPRRSYEGHDRARQPHTGV